MYRERVLDLYYDGFGSRQIAREIRSSPRFVQKVIDHYNEQTTSLRGIRVGVPSPKIDEQVVEYIEVQKLMKPSTYSTELQERLLLDGVAHPANLPSVSQNQQGYSQRACNDEKETYNYSTRIYNP